jgi:hypothetical protein
MIFITITKYDFYYNYKVWFLLQLQSMIFITITKYGIMYDPMYYNYNVWY